MTCAWNELLSVLPMWMRHDVDKLGRDDLQELRLRLNSPPELILSGKSNWLSRRVTQEDLNYVVNTASQYSPWSAAGTEEGFITAIGGHRIGLCGEMVVHQNAGSVIQKLTSLCIRVARDFPGIGAGTEKIRGSILILGPPGWGKTTLLRDVIRQISQQKTVCVADERRELFPEGFSIGKRTDILRGCPKKTAILRLLRTMGPQYIAVDEITDPEDCAALVQACNCGVRLLASAHASSVEDMIKRKVYQSLLKHQVFDNILVLKADHSYTLERMDKWAINGSVRS